MTHQTRGNVFWIKGEIDKAFDEWNTALGLDPANTNAWDSRGVGWVNLGMLKNAGADFDKAIQLDPENASAFSNRGMSRWLFGDHAGAIEDEKDATRLEPQRPDPWSNLALILATSSDSKLRDGPQAVEAARKACELTGWKKSRSLTILAAALAEIGKFEEAIDWQEKAIAITGDPKAKAEFETKLKLYREHKPWRVEVGRRIEGVQVILEHVPVFQ